MTAATRSYRRFVVNVFASAGGRIAAILLALALATVLVRLLGLAGYGTWSFFFTLIGYSALFDLGLGVAVERTVARFHHEADARGIARTLNLGITAALALSALLQALILFLPDRWLAGLGDVEVVRICFHLLPLCLFFSNVSAVASGGLSGLQDIARLNAVRSAAGVVTTSVVIALALGGVRSVPVLLVAYAVGLLATGVWIWHLLRAQVDGLRWRPLYIERELAWEFTRFGGGVQVSNLALQMGDQLLRALLGAHFGAASMGAYDLASRAGHVLRSLGNALLNVMVPFGAAQWLSGSREAVARLHALALTYTALFIAGGTFVALLEARTVLDVWLGGVAGLGDVLRLLQVMLIVNAVQALAGPMGSIGRAAGQALPEAVVNVTSNTLGLIAASMAPTPFWAVLVFSIAVTLGHFVTATWLRVMLDVRAIEAGRMLRLAGVLTLTALAAWGTDALSRRLGLPALVIIPIAGLAAALAMAAGATTLRLLGDDERRVWRALLSWRPGKTRENEEAHNE